MKCLCLDRPDDGNVNSVDPVYLRVITVETYGFKSKLNQFTLKIFKKKNILALEVMLLKKETQTNQYCIQSQSGHIMSLISWTDFRQAVL